MKFTSAVHVMMLLIASPAFGFGRAHAGPPAKLGIISDVDDTVRPTGVLHWKRGLRVALGRKKVKAFSGMPKLYEQLLLAARANPAKDEYFISGSPLTLSFAIDNFLRDNGFSDENIEVRWWGPIRDIAEYKQHKFDEILSKNKRTPFILLGDDGEKDALALAYAAEKYPKQIVGQYIHSIEGVRPAICEKGQLPYFTSVEVALHEMHKGRLSADQVTLVAQAMLDDADFQWDVIPVYAKLCPEAGWITKLIGELEVTLPQRTLDKIGDIQTRVGAICTEDRVPRDFETVEEDVESNRTDQN